MANMTTLPIQDTVGDIPWEFMRRNMKLRCQFGILGRKGNYTTDEPVCS